MMAGFTTIQPKIPTKQVYGDGDLDMRGYRITNLGIPKSPKDAVILALLISGV